MKINERQLRQIIREALLESYFNSFNLKDMQDDDSRNRREWAGKGDITSAGRVSMNGEWGNGEWESVYPTSLSDFWGELISNACHAAGFEDCKLSNRIELSFESDEEMEEFIGELERGNFQEAADFLNRIGQEAESHNGDPNYLPSVGDFSFEVTPDMLKRFFAGFKEVCL